MSYTYGYRFCIGGKKGKNGQVYYKSVPVSCGETTSNETLKWWVRKNKGLSYNDKAQINLADIISMSSGDKTRGKCHIEFQTKENEFMWTFFRRSYSECQSLTLWIK